MAEQSPSSLPGAVLLGRTLAGSYLMESLLGEGGMGSVYVARHVRTGQQCAVKVLHRDAARSDTIYRRFQAEARIASALRHPNIVQVLDFLEDDDGTPFLVMELLAGEDLYRRLCRVGRLPLDRALELATQVGSALQAAHNRGVVHRDIKPENIFLASVSKDGVGPPAEVAKVVDFGISKIRHAASMLTRDLTLLGTPHFMSPEAALGQNSELDGRADQWGLAVILYSVLAGRLPFDGENMMGVLYRVVNEAPPPLGELQPGLPEHVLSAIARGMAKRKEDRFPRMLDFVNALSGIVTTDEGAAQQAAEEESTKVSLGPDPALAPSASSASPVSAASPPPPSASSASSQGMPALPPGADELTRRNIDLAPLPATSPMLDFGRPMASTLSPSRTTPSAISPSYGGLGALRRTSPRRRMVLAVGAIVGVALGAIMLMLWPDRPPREAAVRLRPLAGPVAAAPAEQPDGGPGEKARVEAAPVHAPAAKALAPKKPERRHTTVPARRVAAPPAHAEPDRRKALR